MAKEAGALVYIDAVQYAPHGPIDVQDVGCDFLVCSSYKYSVPQFTRHFHVYGPPRHRANKKMTLWMKNPKWVMGYNQRLSPIFSSETIQ
jgi:kynureninase